MTHNPWTYVGRHRADRPAVTRLPHHRFRPRHCAGTSCVHNHPSQTSPLGVISPRFGRLRSAA